MRGREEDEGRGGVGVGGIRWGSVPRQVPAASFHLSREEHRVKTGHLEPSVRVQVVTEEKSPFNQQMLSSQDFNVEKLTHAQFSKLVLFH